MADGADYGEALAADASEFRSYRPPPRQYPELNEVWGEPDNPVTWRRICRSPPEVCDAVSYWVFGSSSRYTTSHREWSEWVKAHGAIRIHVPKR